MVILGGGAVSYERGTHVFTRQSEQVTKVHGYLAHKKSHIHVPEGTRRYTGTSLIRNPIFMFPKVHEGTWVPRS